MKQTKINQLKICGLTKYNDVKLCVDLGVNFIGFVAYLKSARFIKNDSICDIISQIHSENLTFNNFVAVMVEPTKTDVDDLFNAGCNIFQIHFIDLFSYQKNNKLLKYIKTKYSSSKIILALPVVNADDFMLHNLSLYLNFCDYIILDKKNAQLHGGSGNSFCWQDFFSTLAKTNIYNKIKKQIYNTPFFLSGGINKGNVLQAFEFSEFVDLSSGVEVVNGVKNQEKIIEICNIFNQNNLGKTK